MDRGEQGSGIPSVEILLDKPRKLRLDFNSLVFYEERTGNSFMEKISLGTKARIADLREMLWVALLSDDPALTQDEVGRLIGPANMTLVMGALTEALTGKRAEAPAAPGEPPSPLLQ